MILHIDSDASYLSEPRSRSRTGGNYYLSSLPTDPKKLQNSRRQKMSQSTRNVESSNTWWQLRLKHESGDCYTIGKQRYPYASHSMNSTLPNYQPQSKQKNPWPKASSLLQLDKKRSKAMDTIFYWMKDRVKQK